MITGIQIRIARTALRWSADSLAKKAGIASKTVHRLEQCDGVPRTSAITIMKIQNALEAAGVEFIGTPDVAPGIRLHAQTER